MIDVIKMAEIYARAAHGAINQRRKYTGEPYIVHPQEVVRILQNIGFNDKVWEEMYAAAWLHDVVEDTFLTLSCIERTFGYDISLIVDFLTDRKIEGNRAVRKKYNADRFKDAPKESINIKLADLISNTSTIVLYDKVFAKIYLKEKEYLLKILEERGEFLLVNKAKISLEEGLKLLKEGSK